MSDLFDFTPSAPPFKDIANQRPSAAEEKAQPCLELNALLKKAPRSLGAASIQTIRAFKETHKQALKVLQGKNSTRPELLTAISRIKDFDASPVLTEAINGRVTA